MPLYEYRCEKCDYFFEKLVSLGEKISCPVCGGGVKKLLSTFAIDVPDEICGKLGRGEDRERCTECRRGGEACPIAA